MTEASQDRRTATTRSSGSTVDEAEIAHFAAMAREWWNPRGKFAALHKLNPARLKVFCDAICHHFDLDSKADRPFAGLRIADLGCGGGLICEPMARLGATVVGIDAGAETVEIARAHAQQSGLDIEYRHTTAEALAADGESFDAVLNLEVVEHVADVPVFLAAVSTLTAPGGLQIVTTLNRTARSMALGIVAATYILRWVPRGTHDWRKFLKPSEVAAHLRHNGLTIERVAGLTYNPLSDRWQETDDLRVNYVVVASRETAA